MKKRQSLAEFDKEVLAGAEQFLSDDMLDTMSADALARAKKYLSEQGTDADDILKKAGAVLTHYHDHPANMPHPGSDEAVKAGCRCPVLDNGHGRGRGGDGEKYGWVMNGDCPLHGLTEDEREEDRR